MGMTRPMMKVTSNSPSIVNSSDSSVPAMLRARRRRAAARPSGAAAPLSVPVAAKAYSPFVTCRYMTEVTDPPEFQFCTLFCRPVFSTRWNSGTIGASAWY